MKKLIIIAVSLLTFAACTKKSSSSGPGTSSSDSTFNGSYFQISYNGKNINSKTVTVNYGTPGAIQYNALTSTFAGGEYIIVMVNGSYGIQTLSFAVVGSGTTYSFFSTTPSTFTQTNPVDLFSDTSGTITLSHNGSDYLQGTFTSTLYNTSGFSYPATGSFKIYH